MTWLRKVQGMMNPVGGLSRSVLALTLVAGTALAFPDFDVHPRTIENWIRDRITRDTLRIDNRGDEDLIWELDVPDLEWISASPQDGRVRPGERNWIIVIMDGRDLDEDHYYADLEFTSNDPTRQEYTLPTAGHTAPYPRIIVQWPQGWGEWWGIDMNYFIEEIVWGEVYSFNITVRNPGNARLEVQDITVDNGYFEFDTTEFNLNPGGGRQVRVIFHADEVGRQSGNVASVSNAWDPRELAFRITAGVDPVFRLGSRIPDLVLDEDADELLVADLDTVFISSDRGRELVASGPGLRFRIARSGELFLTPVADWNGETEAVVTATLQDSVLADTFIVDVLPVEDPPGAFDLLQPADGDTVHFGDDGPLFIWQASRDPDGDSVWYELGITPNGIDTARTFGPTADTSMTAALLAEVLDPETGGRFSWTVRASDGDDERGAWSTFTNYVPPAGVGETGTGVPEGWRLAALYPNPFNSRTSILVRVERPLELTVEITDLQGRKVAGFHRRALRAGLQRLEWDASGLPGGSYTISLTADGERVVRRSVLLR